MSDYMSPNRQKCVSLKSGSVYLQSEHEKRLSVDVPNIRLRQHYVNVSVLIKFSQKISVFTIIIVSSP